MAPKEDESELSQNAYMFIWAIASAASLLILIRFF
jgi:hypothetical protein